MRLVCAINSLTGGGAERVMSILVGQFRAAHPDVDLHIVLLDKEPSAYAIPDGVHVHQLDCRKQLLRSLVAFTRLMVQLRPDVCLSFLTRSNFCNVFSRYFAPHRVVISERAHTSGHHSAASISGRVSRFLLQRLYPRADRVIAVSGEIARDLETSFGVSRDRLSVVPNPIDQDQIRSLAATEPVISLPGRYIVGMGRLVPSKNFSLLIAAFAQCRFDGSLVILGDGPERQALVSLARDLGIAERVLFAGFQANPFAIIARSRAFVLCSNAEGFPNSLVEAMMLGVPVIATNCQSGPTEILDDEISMQLDDVREAKFGLLVPINAQAPMARAIDRIEEPGYRAMLAERALAGAARYGLIQTVRAYWSELQPDQPVDQASLLPRVHMR